jgi:rhomboid protease GluP
VICQNCGMESPDGSTTCKSCGAPSVASRAEVSGDVKKCSYCSKPLVGEDAYYFKCRYCGQDFCYEHRLPENHLCKSSPLRRNIPNTASGSYYSTGGGYWASTGKSTQKKQGGSFSINISNQGRNLTIAIVAGLVIGAALYLIGGPILTYYFVQYNALVYSGWIVPLFTSMIVVYPNASGLLDVAFNAFAVVWIDGLFRASYSARTYYAVFIGTGLVGNVLSLLYGANTVSFGASGGIFGLIAGAVTVDYARNGHFNQQLVIWFLFIFFLSTITGGVDIFAHLGGAIAGLIAGYFIGKSGQSQRPKFY